MIPSQATQLLVVDDDHRLTEAISRYLGRSGYAVETANGGAAGLESFEAGKAELVILDVMMPGKDGWEVCRKIRERSQVPIIMLTARDSETDRVMGLRLGADDYVGKPFSLKELEARVEAVLRRSRANPTAGPDAAALHDDGHLRLEPAGMQVLIGGEPTKLTVTERRLLFIMAEQADQIVSGEEILRQVWGAEYDGQSDYVKLYIWRLRQKIEPNPSKPRYILTERGLGYRFKSGAGP